MTQKRDVGRFRLRDGKGIDGTGTDTGKGGILVLDVNQLWPYTYMVFNFT